MIRPGQAKFRPGQAMATGVLIPLDFWAKSGQVTAPDGRCMAGLDLHDRIRFQMNKR
jgi:hypothetical protein